MCGIVGYSGMRNAIPVLIDGLRALEYRGYDSAGVAFVNENRVNIVKKQGKVNVLEEVVLNKYATLGIGHTRWATHGGPSDMNSHPHKVGKITLVHNGIIENYLPLKNEILDTGYLLKSETDTEVVAAVIHRLYEEKKDMVKVLQECKNIFKGSYALAIICEDELDTIYALRKDSPLIVGINDGEFFVASDVPAILKYTNLYMLLDNNDIVVLNKELKVFNEFGDRVEKEVLKFNGSYESATKMGYEHFMLKEISEQPDIVRQLISIYVNKSKLENIPNISEYSEIDIVACGSASHAGFIGKYLIEKNSNIKVNVIIASEYVHQNIHSDNHKLVLIISQSGETADTLAALRLAKENGMNVLSIVNVVGSSIARESDMVIYTNAGCEIAVATTKALSAQIFVLYLLSLSLKDTINMEYLNQLPYLLEKEVEKSYENIAKLIYESEHLFFIGRSIDYYLCMEASLKLKEISYMHSEAYPAGELKHGTISLIEEGTPVIAIITEKEVALKTISSMKEVKARGAKVILIITSDLDENGDYYDEKIVVTKNNVLDAISILIPVQLLAYSTAKLRGCDIDKPRNLAKSVTV